MATPLHDVEALVALAEGHDGPAQAWAAARLALVAPDRFAHFPSGEGPHDEVFAAAPPDLVPMLVRTLRTADPLPVGVAASAAMLGAFGALPEDRGALVGALRAAVHGEGGEADLWLAYALSTLGEADTRVLAAANLVRGPDRAWLLPSVVLRVAEEMGALEEAARVVAGGLAAQGDQRLLLAVLSTLGAPTGAELSGDDDPLAAAERGAAAAGGAVALRSRSGSTKRRIQGAIHELLDGLPGTAPALLRALYAEGADPRWGLEPVAIAAWLRTFVPGDPIDDVLHRLGGADPDRLSHARQRVTVAHRPEVVSALARAHDPTAAVLAMPLLPGDAPLAAAVVDLLVRVGAGDLRADALACAAAWHCADRIPVLLGDRSTRDLGLLVAEWAPTEEVLAALLALPIPADRDPRTQYALCLAAMGDPATVPMLAALLEHDEAGDLVGARVLAESILHQPIR